jgi:hypothetical protein
LLRADLYFAEFSDNLKLTKVIAGAESQLRRTELQNALGDVAPQVECFKARLAFNTFEVVRQLDESLWK